MKRNSFVFYVSYKEALDNLPPQQQLNLYKAICVYAFSGKLTRLTKQEKSIFNLIIPTLDSSIRRYDANVENGKKGGRPTEKEKTQTKPKQNPSITQQKPNDNPTETQQKPKQNPSITQQKPNDNPTETQQKPKQNLNYNYNDNENYNYIYNKLDKTKETKENRTEKNIISDDVVQSSPDKKIFFLDTINEKISKLLKNNIEDSALINRLQSLVNQIAKGKSYLINGQTIDCDVILESLVDLFIGSDTEILERLTTIFDNIDTKSNIFNKFKYSVGVLYNQAKQVISKC